MPQTFEYKNYRRRVTELREHLRGFLQIAEPPGVFDLYDRKALAETYDRLAGIEAAVDEQQARLDEAEAVSSRPGRKGEVRLIAERYDPERGVNVYKEVWFKP